MSSGCFLTWEGGRESRFGVEDNEFGWGHIDLEVCVARVSGAVHRTVGYVGVEPRGEPCAEMQIWWVSSLDGKGSQAGWETASEARVEREGKACQSRGKVTVKGQAEEEVLQRQLKVSTSETWRGRGSVVHAASGEGEFKKEGVVTMLLDTVGIGEMNRNPRKGFSSERVRCWH